MKRFLAFAVSVLLMSSCVTLAQAEGSIDFSSYTLEELLDVKAELVEEISKRPGGEKMVLGAGQYKIGESIPAGIYTFKFVQNGDSDVSRTDYYVYENESMYKYDADRSWLGDMPRLEGSLKGDGEAHIVLYPGEYMRLNYNGAEVVRIGNAPERSNDYVVPAGTTIPKGNYTIGAEIPAGTYRIYYSGTTSSRVRVFVDSEEASGIFNDGVETILSATNPDGMVTLVDGNVLRVEYTSIIMAKSSGFTFD